MTTKQSNVILGLLASEPDGLLPIEVQKLMFLYSQEEEPVYEFVPFTYGCYSPTLRHDLAALADKDLVREVCSGRDRRWIVTDAGLGRVMEIPVVSRRVLRFRTRHPEERYDLVRKVYLGFPYYAIKSRILKEVLGDDRRIETQILKARPVKQTPLASIGYEGRSLENYLNALIRNGIEVLCDVRKNPISRKYGFSKATLEAACKGIDIEYRHYPQLGIPSEERRELNCQADYDQLFDWYEKTVLPQQTDAVAELSNLASTGCGVALTCFEANPAQCHRTRVLAAIEQLTGINAKLI